MRDRAEARCAHVCQDCDDDNGDLVDLDDPGDDGDLDDEILCPRGTEKVEVDKDTYFQCGCQTSQFKIESQ